jgi:opacity protein-like surface antigen
MKFFLAATTATVMMAGAAMAQNTNSPVQQPNGTGTTGAALTQPDISGTNKPNSPVQKVDAPSTVPNNQDLPTSTGQDTKKGTNLGQ